MSSRILRPSTPGCSAVSRRIRFLCRVRERFECFPPLPRKPTASFIASSPLMFRGRFTASCFNEPCCPLASTATDQVEQVRQGSEFNNPVERRRTGSADAGNSRTHRSDDRSATSDHDELWRVRSNDNSAVFRVGNHPHGTRRHPRGAAHPRRRRIRRRLARCRTREISPDIFR